MISKPELTFKARIKVGATIGHDFGYFRWPECKAPGGGSRAEDENMVFTAELHGDGEWIDLRAPGYGVLGGNKYGNGSIHATFDGLEVSEADRDRVIRHIAQKAKDKIDAKIAELQKLIGKAVMGRDAT